MEVRALLLNCHMSAPRAKQTVTFPFYFFDKADVCIEPSIMKAQYYLFLLQVFLLQELTHHISNLHVIQIREREVGIAFDSFLRQMRHSDIEFFTVLTPMEVRARTGFHVTQQHVNWLTSLTSITLYSDITF